MQERERRILALLDPRRECCAVDRTILEIGLRDRGNGPATS